MSRNTRLQHRARWALLGFVLVLLAGIVSPVLAAMQRTTGPDWDSFCHTPSVSAAPADLATPDGMASHHEQLKCPLCWSVSAPPSAPGFLPGAIPGPEPLAAAPAAAALHALAPGFEPARGPPSRRLKSI